MNITILGAGAYALALATRLIKNNNIVIWSAVKEEIDTLSKTKKNDKALKGVKLSDKIIYTTDIKKALEGSKIVIIAVSTKYLRSVCKEVKPYIKDKHIVIASKGIEQESNMFASNIVKEELKTRKLCTISGPSFASDVVNDELIGLSLATTNNITKKEVLKAFSSDTLKLRVTNDFIGTELCGTLKNIIAITSGILDGMNVSESTKAMFLTESINDTKCLIKKLGGNEKTIMSYAGFGDILLTASSTTSRNYTYGKLLATTPSKAKEYLNNNTIEGVYTLESIYGLIKSRNVKMPFIDFIYDVVFEHRKMSDIITFLKEKK